eukprot:gene24994-30193_t
MLLSLSLILCILPPTIAFLWQLPNFSCKVAMSSLEVDRTIPCPYASKCSGAYRSKGCDGSGKIQGGIATVPFFSWWPIKVFRPCPAYLEAGYQYRREGQTMEQVLFSEPSNKMKEKLAADRKQEQEEREAKMMSKKARMLAEENLDEVEQMLKEKFGSKEDEE